MEKEGEERRMTLALPDRGQMLEGHSREAQEVTGALPARQGGEEEKVIGNAIKAMTAATLRNVAKAKQLKQQLSTATLLDTSTGPILVMPSPSISIEKPPLDMPEQHGEPAHDAIVNQEPGPRKRATAPTRRRAPWRPDPAI